MAAELVVRPSLRKAKLSLAPCFLFFCFTVWLWQSAATAWWIMLVGLLPFIGPALTWLDSRRTLLTVEDGVVRYRHGLISESTRSIELAKIQDIRVERSLSQRLWGIGTLVLETAGETSRLALADIDRPQQVADWILNASRKIGRGPVNA
jgi:uncharacterized membrane protein YdbT with pleckstrin-like domain